jgi:hypothetical protein
MAYLEPRTSNPELGTPNRTFELEHELRTENEER